MKRMLVTAGSTAVKVDRVRILTNIFKGRTGETIALAAAEAGWDVTLLTSRDFTDALAGKVSRIPYRTFNELADLMEEEVRDGAYDAVIHSAAVSDYRPDGVYTADTESRLVSLELKGSSAGKIPSTHEELFIRMVPTFKIVDRIRQPWGFGGKLVKFKLQVGMSDDELVAIAKRSLKQSHADVIVANCLEWSSRWAYVIDKDETLVKVSRENLPYALLRRLS